MAFLFLEQASTARSTCQVTREKIEKGEWRVGFEKFNPHNEDELMKIWQKPEPFLRKCITIQYAPDGRSKCKKTHAQIAKGDVRFAVDNTRGTKFNLSVEGAAAVLPAVLEVVPEFEVTSFKGLAKLTASDRERVFKSFKVPDFQADAFNDANPPPEAADIVTSPKAASKRKAAAASTDEVDEASGQDTAVKKQRKGAKSPAAKPQGRRKKT